MMRIQPLLKERILRRLTISAALTTAALTTAALGAVAVPAMAATAAPAATATTAQHTGSMSPAAVSTKIYGYSAFCYATGGRIYAVNANNVHIRNAPDGSWRYPIQKNRYWDDAFRLGGRRGFTRAKASSHQAARSGFPVMPTTTIPKLAGSARTT